MPQIRVSVDARDRLDALARLTGKRGPAAIVELLSFAGLVEVLSCTATRGAHEAEGRPGDAA